MSGSKTHTIRAKRKLPPRVGEICHCYVDPRRPTMRLLGRWPCVRVQDIRIEGDGSYSGTEVTIDGCNLDRDERDTLAQRDGFEAAAGRLPFGVMMDFWKGRLPFHGDVIHWDYTKPVLQEK